MGFRAHGMRTWLIQRLSAVYLAVYILFTTGFFILNTPVDYGAWHAVIATPLISISLVLFFASLLMHAYVGVRDILIDYLPNLAVRFVVMSTVILSLIIEGVWIAMVLFSVVKI